MSASRVIWFDPRGLGASDPVPLNRLGCPEDWVEDAVTVLDAVGCGPVAVSAEGYMGHSAVLLAMKYPKRVQSLVLINSYARLTNDASYPLGVPEESVESVVEWVRRSWGSGQVVAASAPGLGGDPSFLPFCARFERQAASPGTAAAVVRAMYTSDIRSLLTQVCVPTFVAYTGDLPFIGVEHSRYLAERIPGAQLVEGQTTSFYWGDETFSKLLEFTSGEKQAVTERTVTTVLFTDVVDSTGHAATWGDDRWRQTLDHVDDFVTREVERLGGRLVKQTGDGHLAAFASPGAAVRAALSIRIGIRVLEVEMRIGMHTGEVEQRHDGDIGGMAVHVAARVAALASADEVLVSSTVKDLVVGSGFNFLDRGTHTLKGVPDDWRLFAVSNP